MLNQRMLKETLDRVSDSGLRSLIRAFVSIVDSKPNTQTLPWADFRKAISDAADNPGLPEDPPFVALSESKLRDLAMRSSVTDDKSSFRDLVRIDKLVLKNFGSYSGEASIDLGPVGNRNVTVLVGGNGAGKSTLFNAINWALFGEDFLSELHSLQGKTRKDLVSFRALDELSAGSKEVETWVTLWFSVAGSKYYIRRRFASVLLNGEHSPGLVSTGLYKVPVSGSHELLDEDMLRSLLSGLPKTVKDFYLFDGERINQFAAPDSQEEVREAIGRIVGVSELERAASFGAQAASKFRAQHKKVATGSVAESIREDEKHRQVMADREAELERLKDSVANLKGMIARLDKKLRDAPLTKERQERREEYQRNLETAAIDRGEQAHSLRAALSRAATALALPAVDHLRLELDERRSAGDIPGHVSQQLLADLLKARECLCGTALHEGEPAYQRLEAELKRVANQEVTRTFLLELFFELGALRNRVDIHTQDARRSYLKFWKQVDEHERLEAALKGISLELQGLEVGDIDGWEAERSLKQEMLISEQTNLAEVARMLLADGEVSRELQAKIQKQTGNEEKAEQLFRQYSWAEAAVSTLKAIIREFSALARIEVERRTETLWHRLLPNTRGYGVEVTEGFELGVISPAGSSGIAQLSMGQQQCLGLAFITAVAHVAETKPPLVIDMPFGRLDEVTAPEVASVLPGLTYQLVLFLLPGTEWYPAVQDALDESLARVVLLQKDDDENSPTKTSVQSI